MSFNFAPYEAAVACTGSSRSGARALMEWCLAKYSGVARNGGIYNCRSVRGSTTTSIHSEGRALDVMFPVHNGKAHASGTELLNTLARNGTSLGIQSIIWNRKIYSRRTPNGRDYSGVNPHVDHLHIEMVRTSANSLTIAQINSILGSAAPTPALPPTPLNRRTLSIRTPYMTGEDVRYVQHSLKLRVDGIYGENTKTAVVAWQRVNGLVADGIFGQKSWDKLLSLQGR